MLLALAVAAPAAVIGSAMPDPHRLPFAGLVASHALLIARREERAAPGVFAWSGGTAAATMVEADGHRRTLRGVRVEFRGPLVRVLARDDRGRRLRLVWWPDTLPPEARRALARAARAGAPTDISLPSMAA